MENIIYKNDFDRISNYRHCEFLNIRSHCKISLKISLYDYNNRNNIKISYFDNIRELSISDTAQDKLTIYNI